MHICVCQAAQGNVASVVRALREAAGTRTTITISEQPDEIRQADVLVVPGQGSFRTFARTMRSGLDAALLEHLRSGKPYLGICLGMQILFESSEEAPDEPGLGFFAGRVRRLQPGVDAETGRAYRLPHVGWNTARATGAGVASGSYYFAHSFVVEPADATLVATRTDYGETFVSALVSDAVVGVQFHPEKSQRAGISVLANFVGSP